MNKLTTGARLIHHGAALELIAQADEDDASETWWCKLLFVEEDEVTLRTFRKGEPCRAIHGSLSFSA